MKRILSFVALAMISAMSWAEVNITVTPSHVDFGKVSIKGKDMVEGSVTIRVNYSGLQEYCGVYIDEVEMPESGAIFAIEGTQTANFIYGGDDYNPAEGPEVSLAYIAEEAGTYTGKYRLYSYEDEYWSVESESVYLTFKLVVTNDEVVDPVAGKRVYTRVNTTGDLHVGDEVVFVNESAAAVSGVLNGTYLTAVTDGVELDAAAHTIAVPEDAQSFIVSKYSGNWQFTTSDTHQRLHLDAREKGAFTYADTQAGAIYAGWGVDVNDGVATVSRPDDDQSFPVLFNSDRFKPYKSKDGSPIALYKRPGEGLPSGVEQGRTDNCTVQKVLRDGQLLIIRNGETYTVTGKKR